MPETDVHEVKAEAIKPVVRTGLMERAAKLDETLTMFRTELEADRFAPALGKFREAVNLSRAWKELRTRVLRVGADEARNLLPRNWRVADTLLSETTGIEGDYAIPSQLWDKVRAAQHDEVITNALYTVDRAELIDSPEKAREQINRLMVTHPGEARLQARLLEIEEALNPSKPAPVEAAETLASQKPALPAESPLAQHPEAAAEIPAPVGQRVKITITSTALDKAKTAATVAASAAMIVTAVVLIWMHVTQPHRPVKAAPRIVKRMEVEAAPSPDASTVAYAKVSEEKAWQIVETTQKPEDLQFFLKIYPNSAHAVRARVKLEALQAQESNQEDEEREDWKALDHSDPKALESFLVAHPEGTHAGAVKLELDAIRNKAH